MDALATRSTAPAVLAVTRLDVNRKGHFVPNAAAAEVFDSYYAAYPNASDDVVRGRIVLALLDGLTPRAADEAIGVLDRWQAARDAANQLGADASAAERAAARDAELGADLARALSR